MVLGTTGYTAIQQQPEAVASTPLFQTVIMTFGHTTVSVGELMQLLLAGLTIGAILWKVGISGHRKRKKRIKKRRYDDKL